MQMLSLINLKTNKAELMRLIIKLFTLPFLILFSTFSIAMEETSTYLEPQDISDAEWNNINGKVRVYNGCLNQEMVKWVGQGTDPRAVSDQVLELCSFHLIELEKEMGDKNINPEFTKRFIYASKNKAAKKMLGTIMMLMSQSQQAREAGIQAQESANAEEQNPSPVNTKPHITVIKQN